MVELFIAFGAGFISFLSPCVLPLVPGYISFVSGRSLNQLLESKKINLSPLILFSLGFSFVFIVSCNDLLVKKGKKGDFTFRKCSSCKIND